MSNQVSMQRRRRDSDFNCVLGMFFRSVGFENPDAKIVQMGVMLGYTFKESAPCCFRAPGERILPTSGPVTRTSGAAGRLPHR